MKAKNILFVFFGCLLFSFGFLLVSDSTQGQQAGKFLPADLVTKGTIIMWSGDAASIPAGWQLCDGTNGTPDLRDRFVLGTLAGQDPGEKGGSDWIQLVEANMPAHRHWFQTDDGGSHSHGYYDVWESYETHWFGLPNSSYLAWPGDAFFSEPISGDGHEHAGTTHVQGDGTLIDNRPAYYTLAFIMKL